MAFEFSLQTAIVGTLGSSMVLAATLYYLWWQDRTQRALYYWSLAFTAQSLRMGVQLALTLGEARLWFVADALFALVTLLIWIGACAARERPDHRWRVFGLLVLALAWEPLAMTISLPFAARTLPLYALACAVMLTAGAKLIAQARRCPGVGYRGLGVLFALLGIHYLDYPFLRTAPWFAPFGFALAATLMLGIGICMLLIIQRRQQSELRQIANRLQREIDGRRQAERDQQEASERFRALAESSELGLAVTDERGCFVYCNPRYLAIANASFEEVQAGTWIEHLHADDREATRQRWRNAIATQTGFSYERRVIDDAGAVHWVYAHIAPIRAATGSFRGFVATVEDLTALRQAEAALRASEARFAGAFNASLDYITISDLDTGRIIDVNEAFVRTTGWSRDEAIGRTSNALGIWPKPEQRAEMIALLRERGFLREYPMQLGIRSGATVDCLLNASLIDLGDTQLLLGVVRDISLIKRADEALRRNEEYFSRIVHYSPVALAITDAETHHLIDCNSSWQGLLGYTREQVIGRHPNDFGLWADPNDRVVLYRALQAAGDKLDRYEVRYRKADGGILFGLVSGRLFDIGGRRCYLWSVTDITLRHDFEERMKQLNAELETRVEARTAELRHAQDELIRAEKLAALGALVAGVAHELNTPIGNSVTVASTLHDKTAEFAALIAGGELRRSSLNAFLDTARTASDLLLRSLNQARSLVVSFKQVAVDQTSDQRRVFDVREVVDEVLTTLSPTIRKTPYRVVAEIPPGIVVDGFPGPFGQAITNFVTNALLHAFEGRDSGTVSIVAEQPARTDADAPPELILTVADDGIGIADDDLRRIFDPFFTTKLGRGGSGLGLNIVYNIVTRVLGGRISVSSSLGGGTRFVLTMPLCAPTQAAQPDQDNRSTE